MEVPTQVNEPIPQEMSTENILLSIEELTNALENATGNGEIADPYIAENLKICGEELRKKLNSKNSFEKVDESLLSALAEEIRLDAERLNESKTVEEIRQAMIPENLSQVYHTLKEYIQTKVKGEPVTFEDVEEPSEPFISPIP